MSTGATGKSCFYQANSTASYQVLDVQSVSIAEQNDGAVKTFTLNETLNPETTPLLIAGGGMGGIAAALSVLTADSKITVVLTEETSWIGGQMTSQGVSALDENKWVETTGATQNYLKMRQTIREHYQSLPGIKAPAKADQRLNPGLCWVTRLSFEPKLGLKVLEDMLAPYIKQGRLKICTRLKAVAATTSASGDNQVVSAVLFVNLDNGEFSEYHPEYMIDATELGDLLALTKTPYFTGSDDKSRTGEAHAPVQGNSDNVQDFTYPFVLTFEPGQNHTIAKPPGYDQFNSAGKFSLFGFKMFEEYDGTCPVTGKPKHFLPFWTYRRLIAAELFEQQFDRDLSMINWDANDLRGHNIIDVSATEAHQALQLAKQVSLGFIYWLQTEAPRDDGGKGYPELKLDYDLMGSSDGLSLYPYIREARRLDACKIVVEEEIVEGKNPNARASHFRDSIGIGHYPVDIHGLQEVADTAQQTKPFQIPYGALITSSGANLLAGCKNIGVTHITNGAYRLHPIEWAIGTACGAAVAVAREYNTAVNQLQPHIMALQSKLVTLGAPIMWFDDITAEHEAFAAIQILTMLDILPYSKDDLSFRPDSLYTSEELDLIEQKISQLLPKDKVSHVLQIAREHSRAQLAKHIWTLFTASRAVSTV